MQQYLELVRHVLENGVAKGDRTGTGTLSVFGYQMRFDLAAGFPLVTTKKVHLRSIIYELLWFLRGETNVKFLQENKVTIWDEWADANGDLGPVYGYQWRSWPAADGRHIDQMAKVLETLRTDIAFMRRYSGNPSASANSVSFWRIETLPAGVSNSCDIIASARLASSSMIMALTGPSAVGDRDRER